MASFVHRLLASLTLLSVLLGTVGWAHPACAVPVAAASADGGAMPAMAAGMDGSHHAFGARTPRGDCDETRGDHQVDRRTDHRGAPPAGCATVAHCVAVAPAPSAVPAARSARIAQRPREVSATLPRGPALEPEFPPPRA